MSEYGVGAGKVGNWIQTFTGRKVWPLSMEVGDIDIRDIAHALSCIGRFNGHARGFYSVAQHSVLASAFVRTDEIPGDAAPEWLDARLNDQRWALLHDAHEAYIGDIARPMAPQFKRLDEVKQSIDAVVRCRFGITADGGDGSPVRMVDEHLLATEKRDLMVVYIEWPELKKSPLEYTIGECWTPAEAERRFLVRFRELFGNTSGRAFFGVRALDELAIGGAA